MARSALRIVLGGLAALAAAQSNGPTYSPVRPPALPLAVRGPYTSAWTSVGPSGTLNGASPIFWPGTPLGWEGIVRVDGVSYEYLGAGSQSLPTMPSLKSATPLTVSYDSQYSNFTFAAGPVQITASFLSAVIPKDLCRTSIPLSYLTTYIESTDGAAHDVQFYSDIDASWIASESNATVQWSLYQGSNIINGSTNGTSPLYSWIYQLQEQYEFGEENQYPQWGNMTWTTQPQGAKNFTYSGGFNSLDTLFSFVNGQGLSNSVSGDYRGYGQMAPVFSFMHDFGNVSSASAMYTVGSAQTPIMRYLTTEGVVGLQPWWTQCYGDVFQMIDFHWNDFNDTAALAYNFETQLKSDIDAYYASDNATVYGNNTNPGPSPTYSNGTDQEGEQYTFDPDTAYGFLNPNNSSGVGVPDVSEAESYYSIVALSARQVMGAYVLAIPQGTTGNASEPLMFQKEISSDGNVNTVDVMFPAMPFFLYANPELLRYNLEPLIYNQENNFYPNGYSMHDLGSNFPNATGHVEGDDEYMPVEESGNMLLMSYAYYKFSGNSSFLQQHYKLLQQFASYVIDYSLIPGDQLSTDDFAGSLPNQTNLAIKGIVGLQAMSGIASVVGDDTGTANYSSTASSYFDQWKYFGIDPSGKHTLLGYQWRSSAGLLYNIFPDKLLNLGIVSQDVYDMQSEYYPTISQVFGVPLDNRHDWTKSDWEMWTAATCSPSTRRLLVTSLAYWLNNTVTNLPFSDLYTTVSDGDFAQGVLFIARPVVGGHFSLLALHRAGENEDSGTGSAGSVFMPNSTAPLSAEVQLPTLSASRR